MEELEDTRRDIHWDILLVDIMQLLIITMLLVYESLTVTTLDNTSGLLLMVLLKDESMLVTVLVLVVQEILLLFLLPITTIVKQFHYMLLLIMHSFLMTHYGMEPDVQEVLVVMIPLNLGSIISSIRLHKMILKHEYAHMKNIW